MHSLPGLTIIFIFKGFADDENIYVNDDEFAKDDSNDEVLSNDIPKIEKSFQDNKIVQPNNPSMSVLKNDTNTILTLPMLNNTIKKGLDISHDWENDKDTHFSKNKAKSVGVTHENRIANYSTANNVTGSRSKIKNKKISHEKLLSGQKTSKTADKGAANDRSEDLETDKAGIVDDLKKSKSSKQEKTPTPQKSAEQRSSKKSSKFKYQKTKRPSLNKKKMSKKVKTTKKRKINKAHDIKKASKTKDKSGSKDDDMESKFNSLKKDHKRKGKETKKTTAAKNDNEDRQIVPRKNKAIHTKTTLNVESKSNMDKKGNNKKDNKQSAKTPSKRLKNNKGIISKKKKAPKVKKDKSLKKDSRKYQNKDGKNHFDKKSVKKDTVVSGKKASMAESDDEHYEEDAF